MPSHDTTIEALRDQLAIREQQLAILIERAKNSESIATNIHKITLSMVAQRSASSVPVAGLEAMAHWFGLQDSAIRVWGVDPAFSSLPFAAPVDQSLLTFANGLKQPYCGPNHDFSVVNWLSRPVGSLAILALRVTPNAPAFGLLVIGHESATHFSADKSTDLLAQLGQVFSAGLGRLLPPD